MASPTETAVIQIQQAGQFRAGRGVWSCALLLKRLFLVLVADKMNLLLLFGQPIFIALLVSFVVTREASITKKLFLGNIAIMWMACSNAAQVIVRERGIVFREKLAGLRLRSYVLSKYIGMGLISSIQAALLLGVMWLTPNGLFGNFWWQLIALVGTALVLTGIGLVISAASKTPTQAALAVPLVIIPLILLSGFVFPLAEWKTRPTVAFISWLTPSYAVQRLVDMSLLWNQKIDSSGDDFMKYQSAACENLRTSVVPWKVWFTKGDSAQELDPAIIAKLYAPDPPSAEPGVPVTYQWPTPPRFENDRVYLHWDGAKQPLDQLGTWIVVCFIGSWVLLGRIEAH